MRNHFKKICGLIIINTMITLNISSCTNVSKIPTKPSEFKTKIKIGIALYDAEDAFVQTIYDKITDYAKQEEESGEVEFEITQADGENDQDIQNAQIDEFINEKCNVIMVNIVDRSQASTIISKAKSARIPLVFFNREPVPQDMDIWEQVYYVGAMAEQSGKMQAEILINEMENGLKVDKNEDGIIQYVMIEGEPGHQDAILRSYYSIKILEERGYKTQNLATDTGMWRKTNAKIKMLEWLEEFGNEIEVIIANNDQMALGAIEALGEMGYLDDTSTVIPVVGVDGLEPAVAAIKEGKMLGTVFNNADKQARAIFTKGYYLATKNEPKVISSTSYHGKYLRTPYEIIQRNSKNQ